jgi:hypothetical protein
MTPAAFLRTLYLGDRACKGVAIDAWNKVVRVQVNCISRVRSATGEWAFYTAEDITDGWIVFAEADRFELKNDGFIPNDYINDIAVVDESDDSSTVELSITWKIPRDQA